VIDPVLAEAIDVAFDDDITIGVDGVRWLSRAELLTNSRWRSIGLKPRATPGRDSVAANVVRRIVGIIIGDQLTLSIGHSRGQPMVQFDCLPVGVARNQMPIPQPGLFGLVSRASERPPPVEHLPGG